MGHRDMSSIVVMMAAAVVLVGCLINVSEGLNLEPKVFHVGGKVLCQDCSSDWNKWLQGEPIKGAKVSVTCFDERSRVVHYCSDLTDALGEFEMIVDKYIGGKELNPRLCSARLVSSPDLACNVLTNFGNGNTGVKLSRPSFVYRDLIKFVIEPFYFTSPMCEEPDTSDEPEAAEPSPYTSNDEEELYGDKGNNY